MNSDPPDIQLMLVRDPKDTLLALCALEKTFTLQDFAFNYEVIKHLEKPIHIKNAHTHFYSLRLFGFIEQSESKPKGVYSRTDAANEICKIIRKNPKIASKKIRYLLLNNFEKGILFKDFQQFAKEKKVFTIEDVKKRYKKWRTVPSLIEWSVLGKIIDIDKTQQKMWYLGDEEGNNITIVEFWKLFRDLFYQIKYETVFGTDIFYFDISKIRTRMCLKLYWSNEKWNKHMVKLLKSPYGKNLRLYGSTPSTFETKETFLFENTSYAYIGIND